MEYLTSALCIRPRPGSATRKYTFDFLFYNFYKDLNSSPTSVLKTLLLRNFIKIFFMKYKFSTYLCFFIMHCIYICIKNRWDGDNNLILNIYYSENIQYHIAIIPRLSKGLQLILFERTFVRYSSYESSYDEKVWRDSKGLELNDGSAVYYWPSITIKWFNGRVIFNLTIPITLVLQQTKIKFLQSYQWAKCI